MFAEVRFGVKAGPGRYHQDGELLWLLRTRSMVLCQSFRGPGAGHMALLPSLLKLVSPSMEVTHGDLYFPLRTHHED